MLDKERNNLIKHAFQLAGITCPESEPTAAEIDDAAHVLNVMLQSWNNDGFRLFKIKRGYMPFAKNKNEYSLANEAYKAFDEANVNYFNKIGTSELSLSSIANAAPRQKLVVINDVVSNTTTISSVDYTGSVKLSAPLDIPVLANNGVFYGTSLATCGTEIKTISGAFSALSYRNASVMPAIGNTVYFQYNNVWQSATISLVNTVAQTITINRSLFAGKITNGFLIYGSSFYFAKAAKDYPMQYRSIELDHVLPNAVALSVKRDEIVDGALDIESVTDNVVVTKEPFNEDELRDFGKQYLKAENVREPQVQVSWQDLIGVVPITELDWGSVADTSDLQTDDWGYVTDPATTLVDWGTLTSGTAIKSFASTTNDADKYIAVAATSDNTYYLFHKSANTDWEAIDISELNLTEFKLFGYGDNICLYDKERGVFKIEGTTVTNVYNATGAETLVQYKNMMYFISPITSGTNRYITCAANFEDFQTAWEVDLASVGFPAEFQEKLYIGSPETFVTNDMRNFTNIEVFSQGRSVVGNRILNLNYSAYCSFSMDGVHFMPMPLLFSTQSAWGYKDGCTFVAVYGVMMEDGTVGTEIYTTNDFNPVWLPKQRIAGRVTDIVFNNSKAYFISDVEVVSMVYYDDLAADNVSVWMYGEKIGRPQEVMNVMKLSLSTSMQLPMNALALKDFLLLPHEKTNGEPVNYCFMREAEDGKMMVWGTPNKFGEYLRFSYVEPITLLSDARSTPDFPDEYYEAVEDGLAAELAYHYQLPVDRIQALVAKAEASKEKATLHDNEDESYDIVPNQRML